MLITAQDRLQHIRKHVVRTTQAAFAELLGISDVAYGMRERGVTSISADDANLICEKYGISKMWLLYGSGEMMVQGLGVGLLQVFGVALVKNTVQPFAQ